MARKVDINSLACDGCHMTVAELAQKYQVSERRIYQLRNAPEYKMAVKASSRQAYEGALVMAQIASVEAVKTLIDVMQDQTAAPGCRSQAAVQLLQLTAKMTEQSEIIDRLDRLEAAMGAVK